MFFFFIFELFERMFYGDIIAWMAFLLFIACILFVICFGIFFWKLPPLAKKLFWNNIRGGRPIIFEAFDDKTVRATTPSLFREGIAYDKDTGWHFFPRLTKDADIELGDLSSRELVTNAFRMDGAPGSVYLAYSGKGTVVNPELEAVLEHEQRFKLRDGSKKGNPHGGVQIRRETLIAVLQGLKDEYIKIKPVWITYTLDPRKLKQYLPKAFTKSQLIAQEIKIREWLQSLTGGGMGSKALIILMLVILILTIIGLLKNFGAF